MPEEFRLLIPRRLFDGMLDHARAQLPDECCGLLAAFPPLAPVYTAEVLERYPLVNAAASPVEFVSEARGMFEAMRAMHTCGTIVVAVYHSHPRAEAVPSRLDRERNYSPAVMNLIISLKDPAPCVRAWWLTERDHREAAFVIGDGSFLPKSLHSALRKATQIFEKLSD